MENEQQVEQEALERIDEQKIRAEVVSEYGFDEEADAERIEKAVAREVKTRTIAAKAIGSKIKTREELESLKKDPRLVPAPEKKDNVQTSEELDRKLDEKLTARLEKQDLDELDLPEDIKAEVQKVAKIQGVSIKKAASDPYIKSRIDVWEKEQKADEAAVSRSKRGTGGHQAYSIDNPPDVDMSTPEGRAQWDKYIDWAKKQQ